MLNFLSAISTFAIFFLSGCSSVNTEKKKINGYDLDNPDAAYVLPGILKEVSGLTYLYSNFFACIQDENGILFIYDVEKNKLVRQFTFNINGDYEGIARVGSNIFVLRSDGVLFEISDYESEDFNVDVYFTNIPSPDNEGLCLDMDNERLLIACKGRSGKGSEDKNKRVIYGFDLRTKVLTKDPVYEFDLQVIKQFMIDNKINLPLKEKKKGKHNEPRIEFMTSDISINPLTKKLYLLSASDHMLFIFNMNGTIEHIELLNPYMFNSAEGIAFFENGDMLITNEGRGKSPTLLRFNYKK